MRKLIATVLIMSAVILVAADDQIVYDDALQNGWQSYGWATLDFASKSTVHGGINAISVTDSTSSFQAMYLHHGSFNNSTYQSISFWINGGSVGGQQLQIQAELNGVPQAGKPLAVLPANSWQQITVSLADLNVANQTNFDGFWIQNISGAPASTFYVDDINLIAAPPPAQIQVSVDAATVIRTIDARMYGVNIAVWDGLLNDSANDGLLQEMGTQVVRFPGGSESDDYDWQTGRSVSNGGAVQWTNSAANFAYVAEKRGAQAYITVNYGSGTPEQAAAWVAYYNGDVGNATAIGIDAKGRDWKTVGYWAAIRAAAPSTKDDGFNFLRASHPSPYGFRYWEVGNECYGNWEYDQHGMSGSGLSGAPHDAATYAAWFKIFYVKMLAVDPAIRIGAVFDPAFIQRLSAAGAVPHFVIFHRYPQIVGAENDATLLLSSSGVSDDATTVRTAVTNSYGAATGAGIELVVTELNSTVAGVGKQSVSLVNGLFMADSLGCFARTEFNACMWWDLRNGGSFGNISSTLYGWRQFGDYGLLASGDRGDTPANTPYPTFYAAKLLTHWGLGGDRVVSAATNYALLSVHAARLANGNLALLAINKSATANLSATIAIAGFNPDSNAVVYQYGPQNDLANADLSVNSFNTAAPTFNYTLPAYSMTVIVLRGQGNSGMPPVMTSSPVASPSTAIVGVPIQFVAAASGNNLSYVWNFGDGSGGSGPAVSHIFALEGLFPVSVSVSDASGSFTGGSVDVHIVPRDLPLTLTRLAVKLNFARVHHDNIVVAGTVPIPDGFIMSGQIVTLDIGGVVQQFTLDNRGNSPRGNTMLKVSVKTVQGKVNAQDAPFNATFNNGNFAVLSTVGLTNSTETHVPVTVPVVLQFNGKSYFVNSSLIYSAQRGRQGTAK